MDKTIIIKGDHGNITIHVDQVKPYINELLLYINNILNENTTANMLFGHIG